MANLHILLLILSLTLVEGYPRRLRRDTESTQQEKKPDGLENGNPESRPVGKRKEKALEYYSESYLDNPPVIFDSAVGPEFIDFDDELAAALIAYEGQPPASEEEENEILSRTRPSRPKGNSPIYYIRLPPTPYMFIPGMGYVSNPPSLRPPPVVQTESQFINLPVPFVSNGKPTGVYIWNPSTTTTSSQSGYYSPRPKPPLKDSVITSLDKGPYVFNGRPSDIFLLRNAYNTLYADALQNFYP